MGPLSRSRGNIEPADEATQPVAEVLRALAPQIRRWVQRQLGPGPDLDDATQEALIQVADALHRYEGRAKLTTYARRITVRAALRYRRRHATPPSPPLYALDDQRTPEQLAMQRESIRRLYAALDELSPKLRLAFVLCAIEREPHAEAAEIAQVSVSAMKARLKRARAQLAKRLEDDPYLAPLFGRSR